MGDHRDAPVTAAGGIVIRADADGHRVLVVHRPHYDDWSLPKGKLDPGETPAMAAVREVYEETGVRAGIAGRVARTEYSDHRQRAKVVHYFAMTAEADADPRPPDDEVDIVEWWTVDRAVAELTYPRDRSLLATAPLDPVEVLVIRHADAGVRGAEPDRLRPLSPRGEAQAAALVPRLDPYRVVTILSSEATRCIQTVQPLAASRGGEVAIDPCLAEGAGPRGLVSLIERAVDPVVVCSHGDVIGDALRTLHRRGIPLDGDRLDKAGTWSFTVVDGAIGHGEYCAPP